MAGWISSKLKVAETFLQQIDQQAAESLGKNERPRSPSEASHDGALKRTDPPAAVPLKYQLPKKSPTPPPPPPPPLSIGSPPHPDPYPDGRPQRKPFPDPAVADDDWTELLGSPQPSSPAPSPNGSSSSRKTTKKPAISSLLDDRGSRKGLAPGRRPAGGDNVKRLPLQEPASPANDGEPPTVSRPSFSGGSSSLTTQQLDNDEEVGSDSKRQDDSHLLIGKTIADGIGKPGVVVSGEERGRLSNESPGSDTDTGSDSASTSDSEDERRRREERRQKRERMNAEKAAEAIKERENIVARLEGEKQSLEKTLEEGERQQAQEASELQTTMIETMEAVELETQKHNSTRMEALARLVKLETTNAELARALATTQWNLEVEVNRVAELRQQIEVKELALEEHQRMSKIHQGTPSNEVESSKRAELENEILDAEYSLICDKIMKLKETANKLEENIFITRNDIMNPTDVEVELKRRLAQLTDHLIQKQTQVEALSSEKATLVFRIEMVSRLLDENGSSDVISDSGADLVSTSERVDIEAAVCQPSNSSPRRALRERIRSGQQQLGSVVQQLDAIFSSGLVFLRRKPMAKLWALIYVLCLHLWVVYILMSRTTKVSDASSQGAVFSLEAINKTSGS